MTAVLAAPILKDQAKYLHRALVNLLVRNANEKGVSGSVKTTLTVEFNIQGENEKFAVVHIKDMYTGLLDEKI